MTDNDDDDDDSTSRNSGDETDNTTPSFVHPAWLDEEYDSFDDNISLDTCDQIYEADQDFIDAPKHHGQYYLGNTCALDILDVTVSPRTFFQFEYRDIVEYVRTYSVHFTRRRPTQIDILQLNIVRDTYYIIAKTHWIRLIQRHWRNVYQERQRVMGARKQMSELRHRELTGKFTVKWRWLPGIDGMMSMYAPAHHHHLG